ncbi:hypothetical protein D3C81_1835480 [compost metagenome]
MASQPLLSRLTCLLSGLSAAPRSLKPPTRLKPWMPSASQAPAPAKASRNTSAHSWVALRERWCSSASVRIISQAPPWAHSMLRLTTPASRAKGCSKAKNEPS